MNQAATSFSPRVSHHDMANAIRALSMDAVQAAKSGHPGMPMGCADLATVLWTRHLNHMPSDPDWPNRDRFILSAGHGSMLLYSLLYLSGYEDITLDDIRHFRQLGARTCGHPEYGEARGIETTTGPLGQGLGNAVGMALAERLMHARFGDDLVDHYTYALVGDGCLMEGIAQESASLAAHLGLHKLIVLFDDNKISIDGPTSLSTSEDQAARFRALGWDVAEIDGHDPEAIDAAIAQAKTSNAPSFIACRTTIAYGSPNRAGSSASHGAPLGEDEIAATRAQLGWTHQPFEIPDDILDAWRSVHHPHAYQQWHARLDAMDAARRKEFMQSEQTILGNEWQGALDALKRESASSEIKEATRVSSQHVLDAITPHIPAMIGGSADLTGSNNTKAEGFASINAGDYTGRYIYYGIREHAMGAVMNGLALHGGVIPYAGTFLVFSDYMRPAMRLSALMGLRTIHVHTHDSIGLGEDGPTHQPVEHLASLRAMPNMQVMRPADRTETLECWALALQSSKAPTVLALSRQALPAIRTSYDAENRCARGAYSVNAVEHPDIILMATGSEVHLAVQASTILADQHIAARIVSMPCMELFAQQPRAYREDVLGRHVPRIAIEAACSQSWHRWLREDDIFIGLDRFGLSAPAPDIYAHLGITTDAITEAAMQLLQ